MFFKQFFFNEFITFSWSIIVHRERKHDAHFNGIVFMLLKTKIMIEEMT